MGALDGSSIAAIAVDAHARAAARRADLDRIRDALRAAADVRRGFQPETVRVRYSAATSPVTEAEWALAAGAVLLLARRPGLP